jgi:hypothetical protein
VVSVPQSITTAMMSLNLTKQLWLYMAPRKTEIKTKFIILWLINDMN